MAIACIRVFQLSWKPALFQSGIEVPACFGSHAGVASRQQPGHQAITRKPNLPPRDPASAMPRSNQVKSKVPLVGSIWLHITWSR